MAVKTYAYTNVTAGNISVNAGEGVVVLKFRGGRKTTTELLPAKLTTADEAHQKAIENHPDFKSGKIKILGNKKKEAEEKEPVSTLEKVEGISSVAQASEYLIEKYDAKPSEVTTKANIKKFAASKGVEFTDL